MKKCYPEWDNCHVTHMLNFHPPFLEPRRGWNSPQGRLEGQALLQPPDERWNGWSSWNHFISFVSEDLKSHYDLPTLTVAGLKVEGYNVSFCLFKTIYTTDKQANPNIDLKKKQKKNSYLMLMCLNVWFCQS